MRALRVALCQIQSHPAIYAGHTAFPEEPFLPTFESGSLSKLGLKGIDVHAIQELCRTEYARWSRARLGAILRFLKSLDPVPDLVIFPEGGVDLESLSAIRDWSRETGATVLVGTHTPLSTPAALRWYSDLGVSASQRKRAPQGSTGSVLPLVRDGKVQLIPKRRASPFETTDVSPVLSGELVPSVYPIQTGRGASRLVPLVCAEALRDPHLSDCEIVGVVSFDGRPEQFGSFIDNQVRNRRLVLYCNDGHYGKSRICWTNDRRNSNWLIEVAPDGLPVGDALLIVDVDLDAAAVEVGTAAPRSAVRLVKLASVVGQHSAYADVSVSLEAARALPEGLPRATELRRLLESKDLAPVQRLRVGHLADLERRGVPSSDWWDALGRDCVIDGEVGLQELEAHLAGKCRDFLGQAIIADMARRPDVAPVFVALLAECSQRASRVKPGKPVSTTAEEAISVVDRDAEVRTVADFIDSSSTVLEISGLPQIGKSSVIDKAIIQSGVAAVLRIIATSTSSADYLVYSILRTGTGLPEPPYADPLAVVESTAFRSALGRSRIVQFGQRVADETALYNLSDELRQVAQDVCVFLNDRGSHPRLYEASACEFEDERRPVVLARECGELQNASVKNDSQDTAWRDAVSARVAWPRRTPPLRFRSSSCRGSGGVPSPAPGTA